MNTTTKEKISTTRQWHEKPDGPIATREMNREEIEEYRRALVLSYKCENSAIKFHFQRITDVNDTDRDDCLWLKYTLDCEVAGKPSIRTVATLKLPIPAKLREEADKMKREMAKKKGRK